MNSSLQNVGFQLPAAHLGGLSQPLPHLPVASTPFASLQNLQKSAALQQLALQSSLSTLYRQQQAAQLPTFNQPQVNLAAAAAAIVAASQVAHLQTAQSAPPMLSQQYLNPPPAQRPMLHPQLDAAQFDIAQLHALAAVVAAQGSPAQPNQLAAHGAILQAAAAAAAAAAANQYNAGPPTNQSQLDAAPLLLAAQNAHANALWPQQNQAPPQQVDPQLVSALLSGLLNAKADSAHSHAAQQAGYAANYSPQAAALLARSLSLPAGYTMQDALVAQQVQKQAEPGWQAPQRATWHAQPMMMPSASAPMQRNSLDIRPGPNMQGQPLHLRHAGITHAGSRSPPNTHMKASEPLATTPPGSKGVSLESQAASAAVQNLAKLINQAGIVAGRKKSTQEDGDASGKDEFKQQILVQVGEKLARAGFTVEQAVKAGLLGGMYVGEVKVLCAAHESESKRIQDEKAKGIHTTQAVNDDQDPLAALSATGQQSPYLAMAAVLADTDVKTTSDISCRGPPVDPTPQANSPPRSSTPFDVFSYGFFGAKHEDSLIEQLERELSVSSQGQGSAHSMQSVGSLDSSGSRVDSSELGVEMATSPVMMMAAKEPRSMFTLFAANDEEVRPMGKASWLTTGQAGQAGAGMWRKGDGANQHQAAVRQLDRAQR